MLSIAAIALLAGCRGWETEKPPVQIIRNMATQEKGKAYRPDTTGVFASGRIAQEPVPGTVAIGSIDEDLHLNRGEDEKGQAVQTFPSSLKAADGTIPDSLADRGKGRYAIYCTPCHGATGAGEGTVGQKALDGGPRLLVPPPSFNDERRKGLVAGQIYKAITEGVNAGNMPSYAHQISVHDRWAITAYIRRDIQKMPYEGGEVIAAVNVDKPTAAVGAALYKAKGCNACHSIDGSKLVGPSFKGIWGHTAKTNVGEVKVDEAYIRESILQPNAKIVDGYPPAMPPQALNDNELMAITLFIQSLK